MDKIKKIFPNRYIFALSLIALFHVGVNVAWQLLNKAPPTWDSAGHLGLSFLFADRISQLITGQIKILDFLALSNYYPPLIHILGVRLDAKTIDRLSELGIEMGIGPSTLVRMWIMEKLVSFKRKSKQSEAPSQATLHQIKKPKKL